MPRAKIKEVEEKPKVVKVPEGAVVVDEKVEHSLRETLVRRNSKQAYFINRPLRTPFDWTVGQMCDGLKIGGRVYVAPQINDQVSSVLESRLGKGRKEDELIVYGGEPEVDEAEEPVEVEEEVEDTPS